MTSAVRLTSCSVTLSKKANQLHQPTTGSAHGA